MAKHNNLTIAEVAQELRASRSFVRGLIHRGELNAVPIGRGQRRGRWIIPARCLEAYIEDGLAKRKATQPRD